MGNLVDFPSFDTIWSTLHNYSDYGSGSRGTYHFVDGENDTTLYVSVPGYKADDLTVEMHEGQLTVTGKPSTEKSVGVLVPKQINLKFNVQRSYLVDGAELTDGLLAIRLTRPNKTEAMKIPVQTK
jgi:HSP20 family molecular chaperone IbpA